MDSKGQVGAMSTNDDPSTSATKPGEKVPGPKPVDKPASTPGGQKPTGTPGQTSGNP